MEIGCVRLKYGLAILAWCALAACQADQTSSLTPDDLVGNYIYKSEDPENKPSEHEFDHLVLKSDGRYDLVQGGSTKARSETMGMWYFTAGESAIVDLDHSGYPARKKGNEIRLLIDDDVGIWFAKVK